MSSQTIAVDFSTMQMIEISKIVFSETNKNFTRPVTDDFVASIRNQGVLQPILVRPIAGGKYECICGERRLRAAQKNAFVHIPAQIKDLGDEEALDAQASENINREDLTPFQEAKLYKMLYDRLDFIHGQVGRVHELSGRLGKSEAYITQRLKLNDLIPGIAKLLEKDEIQLGHALVASRLSTEHQKEALDVALSTSYDRMTVKEFEQWIQDELMQNLSGAPWKKDDALLLPAAGSCNMCPKRTGSNPMLFGDASKKDSCMDSSCFEKKLAAHLINQVKQLVETKPDIQFLVDRDDLPQDVKKFLSENGIKVLREYADFDDYKHGNSAEIKGMWLTGFDKGKIKTVYARSIKGKASAKVQGGSEKTSAAVVIEGIKMRTKRAAELDDEKVYVQILEAMQKSKSMKADTAASELPIDKILLRWIVLQHAGYDRAYVQGYNFRGKPEEQINQIHKISDKAFIQIARKIMLKQYSGQAPTVHTAGGKILWDLAVQLKEVPVAEYVRTQEEIRDKREERAKERIDALKAEAKPAGKKKEAKNVNVKKKGKD